MRKILFFLAFSSLLIADSPLFMQTHFVSLEQSLQRRHLEQLHYPSLGSWRTWGIVHTRIKQTFIGQKNDFIEIMPQIGVDKEFSMLHSKVFLGMDVNSDIVTLTHPQGTITGKSYGLGGYLLWKWDNEIFTSFSIKFAHFFEEYQTQFFNNALVLFDFGVGKRFFLPNEYFLQPELNFGTGILLDSELSVNRVNEVMKPWAPFSFLGSLGIGKMLGKHQVQTKIKMLYDVGAGGELMVNGISTLATPKQKFDMFLGIDYNAEFLEGSTFYVYADFSALNLDIALGVGFKFEFGIKESDLLKFPSRSLKKLPNTKIK
ncbi:autotransporter outer membrane beta-barrel domain-containing protein [Helicobacter cholecystus]|uniref:autotransporter outer membrane beta-barrel domain-containing protein n=1 Tax=Helicobacter cholecystus TaxID=45498 RepID=UPI002738E8F7|nr:autotransporter outer membrane beta-barrel domain-containing protein [Helicobacter cholecystus]